MSGLIGGFRCVCLHFHSFPCKDLNCITNRVSISKFNVCHNTNQRNQIFLYKYKISFNFYVCECCCLEFFQLIGKFIIIQMRQTKCHKIISESNEICPSVTILQSINHLIKRTKLIHFTGTHLHTLYFIYCDISTLLNSKSNSGALLFFPHLILFKRQTPSLLSAFCVTE